MLVKYKNTEVSLKDDTALKFCAMVCGTVVVGAIVGATAMCHCKHEAFPMIREIAISN